MKRFLLVAIMAFVCLVPAVNGQLAVSSSMGGPGTYCQAVPVAAVAALVASGSFSFCLGFVSEYARIGDAVLLGTTFTGPAVAGATFAFTIPAIQGCTAGTITTAAPNQVGTTGFISARVLITTTGRQCSGIGQWAITVAAQTSILYMPFAAHSLEQNIEQWPVLHAAVDSWPSLNVAITSWPTLVASLSGTVNVVNSGSQAITVSGTLDNLNRLCASSATGTSCTTPTINLGGAITVHNDGTITVINSGGQTMTVSGTLSLSQSGTWTITNAGGESISFAGPLTVHQDQACGASYATRCYGELSGVLDTNSTTTLTVGNQTVTFPTELLVHICGGLPPVNGTCQDVQVQGSSQLLDFWVPVGFFVALIIIAGFIEQMLIRAVLVGLAGTGIFVSWLNGAPITIKGIIALMAAVACIFIIVRAWRERRSDREARGE